MVPITPPATQEVLPIVDPLTRLHQFKPSGPGQERAALNQVVTLMSFQVMVPELSGQLKRRSWLVLRWRNQYIVFVAPCASENVNVSEKTKYCSLWSGIATPEQAGCARLRCRRPAGVKYPGSEIDEVIAERHVRIVEVGSGRLAQPCGVKS